jgi:hypothetical protein
MLTTRERVKLELKLVDAVEDAFLDRLIADASSALAAWAGRPLERSRAVERLPGVDGAILMLARTPVRVVHAVRLAVPGRQVETLPAGGWSLVDPDLGWLHRPDGTWAAPVMGTPVWQVDYDGGWILPGAPDRDLPEAIERACLETVKAAWFARRRDPRVTAERADEVYSGEWRGDRHFLPETARALVPRRPV